MQNLVVFIEPSEDASNISAKAAMLFWNRFCISEESACELSGVYYLKSEEPLNFTLKQKVEGKGKANAGSTEHRTVGVRCSTVRAVRTEQSEQRTVKFLKVDEF